MILNFFFLVHPFFSKSRLKNTNTTESSNLQQNVDFPSIVMIRECLKVVVGKVGEAGWGPHSVSLDYFGPGSVCLIEIEGCCPVMDQFGDGYRQSLWLLVGHQHFHCSA